MNTKQGNEAPQDNFSRLKEILIWDFFHNKDLIKKLEVTKDKINDWDPSFFDHEVMKALALMRNFHIRYDGGGGYKGDDGTMDERSIDLQWQFLSWIVDVVYPVHYIYHLKPSSFSGEIQFS